MTIPEAMGLAVAYHQQGALQQAEHIYRQVLATDPEQVDALHLLGVIAAQLNRRDLAFNYFNQALRLKPDFAEAYCNLATSLAAEGRTDEAIISYRQAIRYKPDYADAHYNLGNKLLEQGKADEAAGCYQQVLRLRPDFADAINNLGSALQKLGKVDEAVACYRQVLRLNPNSAEAYHNLGYVLRGQKNEQEAVPLLRQALRLKPNFPLACNELGLALAALGQPEDALVHFQEAARLDPAFAAAFNNLSVVHLLDRDDVAAALTTCERALAIDPGYAPGHLNRALALLLLGRLQEGWPEYDWRVRCNDYLEMLLPLPHWDGSDLTGKAIVLFAEQGLGDTIQFIRYAPLVKARGATVVAACPSVLLPVLAGCSGIDRFVPKELSAAEAGTVQALLPSLPGIFGTTLDTIPDSVPYLFADPARREFWRQKLAPVSGFKVGIIWQGSPQHPRDRWRSVPLTQFAPLAQVEGVRLFSLQVDVGREQLDALNGRFAITDLGADLASDPFTETAAAMKNLNLVVTIDTAVAHLAGALGVPVWVALPFANDWRWLRARPDSPWYPTMRLFRQQQRGNWQEVFEKIAEALADSTPDRGQ